MVNLDLSFDHFVRSFTLWLAFSLYENTVFMMKSKQKQSPNGNIVKHTETRIPDPGRIRNGVRIVGS